MNIESVAIVGAGAVGASLAHQIWKKEPRLCPAIIADGSRRERYIRKGLMVNGDVLRPEIADSGEFDLVVVATKSYHLEQALTLADRCIGPRTLVMSLLNGIASEVVLGERYGDEQVVPAMILGIDALREDGTIRYMNRGVIHFGENPHVIDQHTHIVELSAWFETMGLGFEVSEDITRTLWRKFMINVGANQVSAALGTPYGKLRTDPKARDLMRGAMEEVVHLSRLEGTGLLDQDVDDWIDLLMTLDPEGKTSMLQDAEASRPMEVDLFAGTVLALADRHGIDVPVNRELYGILMGKMESISR